MAHLQPPSLPSPAIVTQAAVRSLPRWCLWLLCGIYIGAGYLGRGPWKSEDVTSLGVMLQLVSGASSWWQPTLFGQVPEGGALLPYWLGAWSIQLTTPWLDPAIAAQVPFVLALGLVFYFTWHAAFQLALLPQAQPVAFAFGGEASPVDYARTLADSALMALMACLGLAQLSHESSPDLFQLLAVTALLYASSLSARGRPVRRLVAVWLGGLMGLSLSGRPWASVIAATTLPGVHLIWIRCLPQTDAHAGDVPQSSRSSSFGLPSWAWMGIFCALSLLILQAASAPTEGLCRYCDWVMPQPTSFGKLLLWFTWPVWPLVLWTLWQWRRHLLLHHISIPLAFSIGLLGLSAVQEGSQDRVLMLVLPALACLAAFALPTLRRSVSSLIDWFSLLFFSVCAALIWIIWVAMMTGIPAKPAANVARLAPDFVPSFHGLGFGIALLAVCAWLYVLKWRVSHAPTVLWKSLVLPATGSVLCWLLLMSLWLPLLDHSRSYASLSTRLQHYLDQERQGRGAVIHSDATSGVKTASAAPSFCLVMHKLSLAQQAGLLYHGRFDLRLALTFSDATSLPDCAYGLTPVGSIVPNDGYEWFPIHKVYRLTDNKEGLQVYRRVKRVQVAHDPLVNAE